MVVLALRCQKSVARFSALDKTVRSRMSNACAIASRCNNPPASSKSEMVIVPWGLSAVISWSARCDGHFNLHSTGCDVKPSREHSCSFGNYTLPALCPDAS